MKRLIIVFIFFLALTLKAQQDFNIYLRMPVPPKITDWQLDPSILNIIFPKSPDQGFYIFIRLLDQNGAEIVKTNLDDPRIPLFNGTGAPLTLNGRDVFKFNTLNISQHLKSLVTITNLLPEGHYSLCAQLLNEQKLELSNERCKEFDIFIPDPPNLVYPWDDDVINNFPQFSWTPVTTASPGEQIQYKINIAPIFKGQTERNSIESNPSLLSKSVITTSYQYLPSDQPFSFYPDAIGFAWQVQAIDNEGKPVTRNEGRSEIFTFYLKKSQDSTDINVIASKIFTSINNLKLRFKDKEAEAILSKMDSNSRIIIYNINNPDPAYLESLAGDASQLSKALTSNDDEALKLIKETHNDIDSKERTFENLNGSYKAFQIIEFKLIIYQSDGKTPVKEPYFVRAIPWALRNIKRFRNTFNDINVRPDVKIGLVAGIYDVWVVPTSNEEKRFPKENREKEISYPMTNPIEVNIK